MISSGINLVMTVIGFSVSTMFIVFVCTRLICARIHLSSSRRSFPLASRSDLSNLERGLHGLEPVIVANFPTKKFSDEFFSASGDAQCSVCLADYHSDDVLRILPYCGHAFHVMCIDIWLHQQATCPVCRISLRELVERKRPMPPFYSLASRSQYGPDSFEAHSYNYLLARNRFSSGACEAHGISPIQEECRASYGDALECRENTCPIVEGTMPTKGLADKHVESPSNA